MYINNLKFIKAKPCLQHLFITNSYILRLECTESKLLYKKKLLTAIIVDSCDIRISLAIQNRSILYLIEWLADVELKIYIKIANKFIP